MAVNARRLDTKPRDNEAIGKVADALFDAEVASARDRPLRRPGATYRLQVHRGFTLDDVARVVDYLADLGVTDGYLSPYLSARPGSTHGYDVFDYRRINAEIGDRKAHDRLLLKLKERGMGRVLDIVPNHMGVAGLNPFWMDVLETGPQSRYARYFDIDWTPDEGDLDGHVLLPILEDQYGVVLDSGKLVLRRDGGRFLIVYHERELPVAPRSYATVLLARPDDLRVLGDGEEDVQELRSVAASARALPASTLVDAESLRRVRTEAEVMKRRLARLVESHPRIGGYLDAVLADFKGREGQPSSFDRLHGLLEEQFYRLSFWRVASEEINYRRFFDINDLAGLRVEDPRVFAATHSRILRWVAEGGVTGLRIDHPDGLSDPAGYFRRLQESIFLRACRARFEAEPSADAPWRSVAAQIRRRYRREVEASRKSPLVRPFPIVVEKILTKDEPIPKDWPIDGTVGYEFLNAVNGLYVDPAAEESLLTTYRDFTGESTRFRSILFEAKRLITRSSLASERNMLARRLARIASRDRRSRDFTRAELGRALGTIMATFGVYRTYLQPDQSVSPRDRRVIEAAVAKARKANPTIDASVFNFIHDILVLNHPEGLPAAVIAEREAFAVRFQQTTGPVQAKGLEDTTFYRYVPLSSLNEVGGDPSRFGTTVEAFHDRNARRLASWPDGLLATATHDTKRGEDARIRIDALSEFPREWSEAIAGWKEMNAVHKRQTPRGLAPDAREEYLFYQTLLGSWPIGGGPDSVTDEYVARLQAYMTKAAREAKVNTSWTEQDPTHVDALTAFVSAVLTGPESRTFLQDVCRLQTLVSRVGVVHSLSQTLIKLTTPGVPDIYQGCELWDLSLVDPDNRRPVDYTGRIAILDAIKGRLDGGESRSSVVSSLLASPDDGAIKLYLIWTALADRHEQPDLYRRGSYLPLEVTGDHADRVVAFARSLGDRSAIVVAPRLLAPLMGEGCGALPVGSAWGSTSLTLPPNLGASRWSERLTGETLDAKAGGSVPLSSILSKVPIALLTPTR